MNIEDKKIYFKIIYLVFIIISVIGGNLYMGTAIDINSYILIAIIYLYLYLTDYLEFQKNSKFKPWVVSLPFYLTLSVLLWSFSKSGIIHFKFFILWVTGNLFREFLVQINGKGEKAIYIGNEVNCQATFERLINKNLEFLMVEGDKYRGKLEVFLKKNNSAYIVAEEETVSSDPGFFLKLKLKGHRIYFPWQYQEELNKRIDVKSINDKSLFYSGGFEIYHDDFQKKIKRIFDITLSLLLVIMTFPVMLVAYITIKAESSGPAFYKQKRVGCNGKEFTLYKFRSMREDAEKDGARWASENDERVTRFGKFIRKTRIDELPQVVNILKGEMSFIGPRPERKVFVEELKKEIPFYDLRHSIKPGLTGWAQVMYPYGASIEDALYKLEYDLYYIKYQDFMLDLTILFKTLKIVVFGSGR